MDEKDKIIAILIAHIAELKAIIDTQAARIAELERRLGLNSSNSSKPPSSDGLRKPAPASLRPKGQRPSGGQVGHEGHTLKQVSEPDSIVIHTVNACDACHNSLQEVMPIYYIKRQVFDIPEPRIEVVEYQAEVKVCSCGHQTTAAFASEVLAPVQYGQRVKALAVYFSNQQFIPEGRLQQTFSDLFNLSISTATLAEMNTEFAQKVAPFQEEVLDYLKKVDVKGADESGLRVAGKTHWLHTLGNTEATYYRISAQRGDITKDISGTLIHDGWKPYFKMEGVTHALCNAHHLRELTALEEIEQEPWASRMKLYLLSLNSMKSDPLSIEFISDWYDNIVAQGLRFHEDMPQLSVRKNKRRIGHNLLLRLFKYKSAVLRFITTPGTPFTNNQSEQDIRMMKVKQKISGGFRSFKGATIFCTIRGFISTKRKKNHNVFQSIQAKFA